MIYASCDYVVFCYFAVSAVCYLSGYDHRDPRDRKDLKYLPFDLPPPVTLLLAALADGILYYLKSDSCSVSQCVLMSDDGCCTTRHHHHQA